MRSTPLRPPSIDRILELALPLVGSELDHEAVLKVARVVQAEESRRILAGDAARPPRILAEDVAARLAALAGSTGPELVSVINATGVVIHTNLGRAAWPTAAIEAAAQAALGPTLLELDRKTGKRGPRWRGAEEHLIALTGADDALVTNNNAAALALAVGFVGRRGIAVSRGELMEIGGGVRIHDIVRRAGARLVEVGTTNRTRAADFEQALAEGRAELILRIHPSNFRQSGYVEAPNQAELANVARRYGVPLIEDIGSGALVDMAEFGLVHEPMPQERLAAGADVVTFSGDKLLGGPQAGLIVGRADLVARMRADPLARMMRPDRVKLASVAATLGLYRAGRALLDIPTLRTISVSTADLLERASRLCSVLEQSSVNATVVDTEATVGGGSLPGETLPSVGLRLVQGSASELLGRLRDAEPCVVARINRGAVVVDLRTVDPSQDEALGRVIIGAVSSTAT